MTCEEIIKELKDFKKEIRKELNDNETDFSALMSKIIKTTSEYPEQKGIVELMVLMQDHMSRDNRRSKDKIMDIVDTIVDYKINTLENVSTIKNDQNIKKESKVNKVKHIWNVILNSPFFLKIFILSSLIIMFFLLFLLFPKKADKFIKEEIPILTKTYKGIQKWLKK